MHNTLHYDDYAYTRTLHISYNAISRTCTWKMIEHLSSAIMKNNVIHKQNLVNKKKCKYLVIQFYNKRIMLCKLHAYR